MLTSAVRHVLKHKRGWAARDDALAAADAARAARAAAPPPRALGDRAYDEDGYEALHDAKMRELSALLEAARGLPVGPEDALAPPPLWLTRSARA